MKLVERTHCYGCNHLLNSTWKQNDEAHDFLGTKKSWTFTIKHVQR